jgi:hypothetical protein
MLLAVIAAASLHARITDVGLSSSDAHSSLRMSVSGAPYSLVVRRDGDLTRVLLERTDLGPAFSSGDRFQWLWTPGPHEPATRRVHTPEAFWIERQRGRVSVSLRVPADVSIEPRQESAAVVLVFRKPRVGLPASTLVASVEPAPAAVLPPVEPPALATPLPAPTRAPSLPPPP